MDNHDCRAHRHERAQATGAAEVEVVNRSPISSAQAPTSFFSCLATDAMGSGWCTRRPGGLQKSTSTAAPTGSEGSEDSSPFPGKEEQKGIQDTHGGGVKFSVLSRCAATVDVAPCNMYNVPSQISGS